MHRLAAAVLCAALLGAAAGAGAHPQEIDEGPAPSPFESDVECQDGLAGDRPCWNVHLEAFVPLAEFGANAANDVWGWTDPATGVEYALLGLRDGTAFVDLRDPHHPVYLGRLRTRTTISPWRDIKVVGHYALIVSEARLHGMQVFDLTRLRDVVAPPVQFTHDAVYRGFGRAHNLAVDEATGRAFAVGSDTCLGGLHIMDVSVPTAPAFAGCFFADGYTHDAQCVVYAGPDEAYRGHEICFASNEDTLTIVDVSDPGQPALLARVPYGGSGYTHQGWLTEDQRYFLLDDELDELLDHVPTRTYVWNVSDLDDPFVTGFHAAGTGSIDHNQYVLGNHVFQANYTGGVRILRLGDLDAAELAEVAFLDTSPGDERTAFSGVWSVYPFFASGLAVASDISRGLFVLKPDLAAVPECADGIDNDGDGFRDHPDDATCVADDDPSESRRVDVVVEIRPRSPSGVVDPRRDRGIEVALLPTDSVDFGDLDPATLALGPGAAAPTAPGMLHAFQGSARAARAGAERARELRLQFPVVPADYPPGESVLCLTGLLGGDPFEACDGVRALGAP